METNLDPRKLNKLASILVNHSVGLKKNENLLILMIEPECFPLVSAIHREAVKLGANVLVKLDSWDFTRNRVLGSPAGKLDEVGTAYRKLLDWADGWIGIRAMRNPHEFSDLPQKRLHRVNVAAGKDTKYRVAKTRWVICRYPTESFAQSAKMSYSEALRFFFKAVLIDWEKEARRCQPIVARFQKASQVRIVGAGTDLSFSTSGRKYVLSNGRHNIPDGEFFTAPVKDTVEGKITFEFEQFQGGSLVKGASLTFKKGKVVEARAGEGEASLRRVLATDAGSNYVGEFGVGINFGIDRYINNGLFDEKIGGTIHLALGNSYKECGGKNQSAIHWDLIKDLRKEGAIFLDGKKVFERGHFLIK